MVSASAVVICNIWSKSSGWKGFTVYQKLAKNLKPKSGAFSMCVHTHTHTVNALMRTKMRMPSAAWPYGIFMRNVSGSLGGLGCFGVWLSERSR